MSAESCAFSVELADDDELAELAFTAAISRGVQLQELEAATRELTALSPSQPSHVTSVEGTFHAETLQRPTMQPYNTWQSVGSGHGGFIDSYDPYIT
jgi:hypothetical protein